MKTDSDQSSPSAGKNTLRRRRSLRRLILLALIVFLLLSLLPEALRLGTIAWLNRQPGISAHVRDIDLNLFSGLFRIEEARLLSNGEEAFSVQQAEIQLDWWPLWKKHLRVEHFSVDKMTVLIETLPDKPLRIAGLTLQAPPDHPDEAGSDLLDNPWGINTGRVRLDQVAVIVRQRHADTRVVIDHLTSAPLVSWHPQQAGTFAMDLSVAGGSLQCRGENRPFTRPAQTDLTVQLDALSLDTLEASLAPLGWNQVRGLVNGEIEIAAVAPLDSQPARIKLSGQLDAKNLAASHAALWIKQLAVSWQGEMDLRLSSSPHLAGKNHLQLNSAAIELQSSGMGLDAETVTWDGNLSLTDELGINGRLSANHLSVTDLSRQNTLLAVENGLAGPFEFNPQNGLRISDVALEGVRLLGRSDPKPPRQPEVVNATQLTAQQLVWSPEGSLTLQHATAGGVTADLVLLPGGGLEARQWLPFSPETEVVTSESVQDEDSDNSPFLFAANQLTINGPSRLIFEDQSTTPASRFSVSELNCSLADLDMRQPEQFSALQIHGMLDDYSRISAQAKVALLAEAPSFDGEAELREFPLPTVSPYLERGIGYRLEQGHLNLRLSGAVTKGAADLTSRLQLMRLQLRPLTDDDEQDVSKRLGLPVNMALSLLRDRNGDISLDIPVRGELLRPDVALGSVIRKAVVGAIKNTVSLTLAPLGVVAKAGQLVGIGGRLTFDPLVFESGTDQLTADSREYLSRLRELLEERPQVVVSLCGQVALREQKNVKPVAGTVSQAAGSALSVDQVRELATRRAERVKLLLVEGQRVHPSQVLLCNPPQQPVDGPAAVMVRF